MNAVMKAIRFNKSVLGMNRRNIELVTPRNPRKYFPIANDKLLSKTVLSKAGVPVATTLATFRSFYELNRFDEKISGLDDFVIKPSQGSGGRGILVISKRDHTYFYTPGGNRYTKSALIKHIGDIIFGVYALDKADVAIIEPRLVPAQPFANLFQNGLSDLRLIWIDRLFCVCMMRVPTDGSDGKANLHQGAIGIAVNTETGTTYRAWQNKREIYIHPETQKPLLGIEISGWSQIVDIARKTADALPLNFLGIDMVVDKTRGPLVLEVNVRPGIEIQNVTGIPLREALAKSGILKR